MPLAAKHQILWDCGLRSDTWTVKCYLYSRFSGDFSAILDPQALHAKSVMSAVHDLALTFSTGLAVVPAELRCLPTHRPLKMSAVTVLSFLQQVLSLKMLSLVTDLFRICIPLQLWFLQCGYLLGSLLLIFLPGGLSIGMWAGAVY